MSLILDTQSAAPVRKSERPGWPEIVVGLVVFALVGYGGGIFVAGLPISPIAVGLIFTALSAIAGMAGFAAAAAIRLRSWEAFGIRRTTRRWLLIGVGVGVIAFIVKGFAILGYSALTGQTSNPQDIYALGGSGGWWTLVLATFFIGVLTPIGEEFLFRGVLTNALLRYSPFIGVVGSTIIFALMHGINIVLPAAFVGGLAMAEIFRRSGSIWPGVVVHVVFNLPTVPVLVMASRMG
ncbi:CPBP family intramembrane glutamic endopeptidase [Aliihoeflea sp. PC F10.4]